MTISRARAELIAKAHACDNCGEYTYRKLTVKEATPAHREELKVEWQVVRICGVCGQHHELGLDAEGEIVYVS